MRHVRLITRWGDGLGLLYHMVRAGTSGSFHTDDGATRQCYVGMVDHVGTKADGVDRGSDLILYDMVGLGSGADSLQRDGYHVYGASGLADTLEMDKEFFLKIARSYDLATPEHRVLPAGADLRQELAGESLWTFKLAKGSPSAWVFVPADGKEQLAFLDFWSTQQSADLLAQKKMGGVDCAIGCFYYAGEPIMETVHSAIEFRRFMAGSVGPVTGGVGCVAWWWRNPRNKLWRNTHERILPFLKRHKYTGPLLIRASLSEERDHRPYVLECVCRFEYPIIYALCEGLGVSVAEFIARMATGQPGDLNISNDWLAGALLTIPPYPSMVNASVTAGRVIDEETGQSRWFWPMDVRRDEQGRLVTAGSDGAVGVVTATAASLPDLQPALYGRVASVALLDKQYRTDLVSVAVERIAKLVAWKYLS